MDRRTVITSSLLIALLPGCSLLAKNFEHRIKVQNSADEDYTAEVSISEGEREIFTEMNTVDSGENWRVRDITSRGVYTISVSLDNDESIEITHDIPIDTGRTIESERRAYTQFIIQEDGTLDSTVFWED